MWNRMPWQEALVEIVVALCFLAAPIGVGILGGVEPLVIVLATGAMIAMGMMSISNYEAWRAPFRNRVLSGAALMQAIDGWLRDEGWVRGPANLAGYAHAIQVSAGGKSSFRMNIAVEEGRNVLVFSTARREENDELRDLAVDQQEQMKNEIATELARLGGFYDVQESPFMITFWDALAVDSSLTPAKVLEKVLFINRLDALVLLVARKYLISALLSGPASVPDWRTVAEKFLEDELGQASG